MKIRCTKKSLQKSVTIALKAVPSKTTMSILQCILIDASSNVIKFIANDMELGIETIVEGEIEEKGIIALDAKLFSNIVRGLPDEEITIATDDKYTAQISWSRNKGYTIAGKSGEDFAYLPIIDREHSLSISQFTLKEMIQQTIFSIAQNENNPIMMGELFEIKDNVLRIISLDGHRISIRRMELANDYADQKVIIPGKTLNEISKILSGNIDSFVNIFFTPNNILFEFDDTTVVSRLIEGEYFRVDQMLSNDYETKVVINKNAFLSSIDRASVLVKEGDKKPLIFNIMDDKMVLKMSDSLNTMTDEIEIEKAGKDLLIGFNPKFLNDALKVIDDEYVTMYLVNAKAPCFIRDDEEKYTYLILPVNINQNQGR